MLSREITIEYNKLLKIREQIDQILQKSNNREIDTNYNKILERKKIDSDYELDEKEKEILDCVFSNPGINKETVINKLGKTSRSPIINRINRLEQLGYIIIKKMKKISDTINCIIMMKIH
jgi:uncharacterized membrane protein